MIDFRYHLVSIVSIFFALAVGIVLGAGPLQGQIGDTLSNEIAGLRQDKTDLNEQLDGARAGIDARDDYLTATNPQVLAGVLQDRTVALVVLPGAESSVVEALTETIGTSGARVASTTTVSEDWVSTDSATSATREAVVSRVAPAVGVDVDENGAGAPRDVLLSALLTRPAQEGDALEVEAARAGLQSLADAGLVSVEADEVEPAQLVVVVSGAVPPADGDAASRTAQQWVALGVELAARSAGAVVAADLETEDEGVSVVGALRSDGNASEVASSVDDTGDPLGRASVVHGLAQQAGGGVGHYGLGPGADAPFAPLPAT